MPFKKVGEDDYTSPSGRHFTQKQVNLYYATNGFQESKMSKGSGPKEAHYAKGGPVLGRTREFVKEPVEFRRPEEGCKTPGGVLADEDQAYGKSGPGKGKGEFGGAPAARKTKVLK